MKLNLGCGSNKLIDYVNIDVEKSCEPDWVCDFTTEHLPYEDSSVSRVVMFHTIEHINKTKRPFVFSEIFRVLKPKGSLIISYPEFTKIVNNWAYNKNGMKDFWEATIYGRQLYPSDYHVAIMHTDDFKQELRDYGFDEISAFPEPDQDFNTVLMAKKMEKPTGYEELVFRDMKKMKLVGA